VIRWNRLSIKVTERTLYDYIGKVFNKFGWRCFPETGLEQKQPDLIIEGDDIRVVSEVKINSETQLTKAIVDAHVKAGMLRTRNAMALLFPRSIRDIPPSELDRVYPRLPVSVLFLTDWLADRRELVLEDLADLFTTSFKDWVETKKVKVSYDLVVEAARDSIREIAAYLRQYLIQKPFFDTAMAVIGRFDIYKSLLEDFSGVSENEAKLYVADITAYILVNQLLFYHIISEKMGYDKLPDVDPLSPSKDFLNILSETFVKARTDYPHILGFNLFPILAGDYRIFYSVARFVSILKALRPQHIQEDLFGRLYHETIPPETRKNLGAFYTKPEAAKLLATLAIDKWDAKILDPACGSGTLLVEAYQRKGELAPPMSRSEMHEKFINDIYGIDIMHFASHITSMNLTAQNIDIRLKPHVFSQDGIETLVRSAIKNNKTNDPPPAMTESLSRWLELMTEEIIPNDFDIVIMNPPFTRRERIPAEKEDLEKLVPEVKGKTGYWAYFVAVADKILKPNGILAVVMPEEFFVGGSALSVRNYLIKKDYGICYVMRSASEIAFSESAHYRDYLIVLKKKYQGPLVVAILKKKLYDVKGQVVDLAIKVKELSSSLNDRLDLDELEAVKITNPRDLISKHIDNLKPLVGFNTIKGHKLGLELLERIGETKTLGELNKSGLIKLRLYRPGQHITKGVEKYAEKLFISRYKARSPNVLFLLKKEQDKSLELSLKNTDTSLKVPLDATVYSLRSYSGIYHLDITDEEEMAIVDTKVLPRYILNLVGLMPYESVSLAAKDIKKAYERFSGNILLARRIRLTSPNAFWTAFYSENNVLGSQLPNIQVMDSNYGKLLNLNLNSIITLIQLLSFVAETEGAWVSLDHKRVWSNIHIPDINKIGKRKIKKYLRLFNHIGKVKANSLYRRISEHDPIQRSIDEIALDMFGLEDWKNRLDEIYDIVAKELQIMQKILGTSKSKSKKARNKRTSAEERNDESLTRWFETLKPK